MQIKATEIFNYHTDKTIYINFEKFIERQMLINDHFPNPNRDSGKFINVFDNMVGQIIEEAYEFQEALSKSNNTTAFSKEALEEFIDMFMYTGSLICETCIHFDIDPLRCFRDTHYNLLEIKDDIYLNSYVPNAYINRYKDDIVPLDFLPAIRRKIYDRKYHKPAGEMPECYEKNLLIDMIRYIYLPKNGVVDTTFQYKMLPENHKLYSFCDNINPLLQKILFCYDMKNISDDDRKKNIKDRIVLMNSIIDKKENFIANL